MLSLKMFCCLFRVANDTATRCTVRPRQSGQNYKRLVEGRAGGGGNGNGGGDTGTTKNEEKGE